MNDGDYFCSHCPIDVSRLHLFGLLPKLSALLRVLTGHRSFSSENDDVFNLRVFISIELEKIAACSESTGMELSSFDVFRRIATIKKVPPSRK